MDYLYLYCLFAVTTALASVYELLMPVVQLENKQGKVEYKGIMYFSFFTLSLLIAPLVFLSCIIPSVGERFRKSLQEGLFPKE